MPAMPGALKGFPAVPSGRSKNHIPKTPSVRRGDRSRLLKLPSVAILAQAFGLCLSGASWLRGAASFVYGGAQRLRTNDDRGRGDEETPRRLDSLVSAYCLRRNKRVKASRWGGRPNHPQGRQRGGPLRAVAGCCFFHKHPPAQAAPGSGPAGGLEKMPRAAAQQRSLSPFVTP